MNKLPRIYRPEEQKLPRIYRPEEHAHPEAEAVPTVQAFMTEKGSIYAYDNFGRTTRHKAKTGEQYPAQDLTVFAELSDVDKQYFLEAIHNSMDANSGVYIVERQDNDGAKKVRRPDQITNPDNVYLAVCLVDRSLKTDQNVTQILKARKASLAPQVGSYVYDMRTFTGDDGKPMVERHLGHRVTEIR